ncbi:MAG: hypothetical protein Q7O04_03050 [Candidatus Omnitrophota bacterium]|nr:hypothetical protein [Candidatus Omnitrophota bacterium]
MRRRLDSKPKSYPEGVDVDVAGISGKVSAYYPGRSAQRNEQKSAEGIVSPAYNGDEGPNMKLRE